jgi:hypothetical protein
MSPKILNSRPTPVNNRFGPEPVITGSVVEKNRNEPVLQGPVRLLVSSENDVVGCGSGSTQKGKKTGPDRTFKHYMSHSKYKYIIFFLNFQRKREAK